MLTRLWSPIAHQTRQMATKQPKVKLKVKMDEETHKLIEADELKPRKHSGRVNRQLQDLPGWLAQAMQKTLEDSPLTTIVADSTKLFNFLKSRHAPAEQSALTAKYSDIRADIAANRKFDETSDTPEDLENREHVMTLQILKRTAHAWAPVLYNRYSSLLYLVSRSAQEYAILRMIFGEIAARDEEFKPETLLDFGSGVGTALWASSQVWPNSFREHMCVDSSACMNDLSEFIVNQANPPFKAVYYRQFIPLSNRKYDVVVAAFTLLELPNMKTRLETIAKLWDKTGSYLILVEQGTNAGFKVVNEARECILHVNKSREETDKQAAHVFSPCPHDQRCPRYNDRNDKTPCNFEANYKPLPLRNNADPGVERFSYVVLKKGKRSEIAKNWPRIVRPVLLRSHHAICRLCTPRGKLDEIIVSPAKHGKLMYRCAKSSRWGDRLPLEILDDDHKDQEEEKDREKEQEEDQEGDQEEQKRE